MKHKISDIRLWILKVKDDMEKEVDWKNRGNSNIFKEWYEFFKDIKCSDWN